MPKLTQYPGLRCHVRKSKRNGNVRRYWFLDHRMFGTEKDIPLGTDYEEAVTQWDEWRNKKPRILGTLEEAFKRWEEEELPKRNQATRRQYAQNLKQMRPSFGVATWEAVKFKHIAEYLDKRSAKFRANREMTLLGTIWRWAMRKGLTDVPFPAMGRDWKNDEPGREFQVTDAMFQAVYEQADQVLRDCMDLATSTGLRLTDCRLILCPAEGQPLRVRASKTGKAAEFVVESSPVLKALVARRRAITADHLMLLTTPNGKQVTQSMLRTRYDEARERAVKKAQEDGKKLLAEQLGKMFLRDMRKMAADLAENAEEASKLLQHSSVSLTSKHYRTRADQLRPVR